MKELCGGFVVCGAHFGALEGDVVKRGDLGLQHLVLVKLGLRLEFRVNVESLLITLEGKVWAAPLLLHAGHVRVHAGDCRVPAAVALLEDGECFLQVGQRHVGLLWLQLKGDADAVLHGGKLPVLLPVHLLDDGQRLFERLLGLLSSPLPLLHPPQSHGCICRLHAPRTMCLPCLFQPSLKHRNTLLAVLLPAALLIRCLATKNTTSALFHLLLRPLAYAALLYLLCLLRHCCGRSSRSQRHKIPGLCPCCCG
mmetsp:Transcript_36570/g.85841  ORF Transcript_36570/g.85841 Transcript_36570/m.85841 type:complete len:253 (-) Transcript_36570:190-948(-)